MYNLWDPRKKTVSGFVLNWSKSFNILIVILVYVIFALIFTYPLILNLNTAIAGNKYGEMWSHLWGFHWVKAHYIANGSFPFNATSLNFPYGGSLFFIDPLGALLSIPLQMVMSVQAAYNILIIFNLVFGAYSAFLLANYILKNWAPAFYSGVVFSFSSYMLSSISTGTSEIFNIGWIPLFIYFFMRSIYESSYKYAFFSGVSLFMTVFANFYYGLFNTLFASFIFFYFVYEKLRENELISNNRIKLNYQVSKIFYSIKKKFTKFIFPKKKPRISLVTQPEHNDSSVNRSHKSGYIYKIMAYLSGLIHRLYKSPEAIHIKTRRLIPVILLIICLMGLFIIYLLLPGSLIPLIVFASVISLLSLIICSVFTGMELKTRNKLDSNSNITEHIPTVKDLIIQSSPFFILILSIVNLFCLTRFYNYMCGYYPDFFLVMDYSFSFLLLAGSLIYMLFKHISFQGNSDKTTKTRDQKEREKILNRLRIFTMEFATKTVPVIVLIGITALIPVIPYLYIFDTPLRSDDSIILRSSLKEKGVFPRKIMNEILMGDNSTPLLDYVRIGKRNLLRRYYPHYFNLITNSSYIGILTLFFCFIAFLKGRRTKSFWLWAVSGFLFLILSLGPYFSITRNLNLKNPFFLYMTFYSLFPFFHRITIPTRLALCTLLCFSILAGFGINFLVRNLSSVAKNISVFIFSLFAMIEIMLLSPAPFPIELCKIKIPEFYRQVANDNEFYGIIESPIKKFKGGIYYQLIHKKGIILSVSDTTPRILQKNIFLLYLYNIEGGLPSNPDVFSEERLQKSFQELKKIRVRYIVVHNSYLGNRKEIVNTFLSHFAGKPIVSEYGILIYRIY